MTFTFRWWYLAILGGSLLASFIAGRGSVPRPGAIPLPPQSRDGGVPETVAKATVGGETDVSTFKCTVAPPPKPIVRYVKGDTVTLACPEQQCPTLVCEGTNTSVREQSSAQSSTPVLPTPSCPPPVAVRNWGIGLAGVAAGGVVQPGAALSWQPLSWLEFHGAGSVNGGEADILIRF